MKQFDSSRAIRVDYIIVETDNGIREKYIDVLMYDDGDALVIYHTALNKFFLFRSDHVMRLEFKVSENPDDLIPLKKEVVKLEDVKDYNPFEDEELYHSIMNSLVEYVASLKNKEEKEGAPADVNIVTHT